MIVMIDTELKCCLCNEHWSLDSVVLPDEVRNEVIMIHESCLKRADIIDKLDEREPLLPQLKRFL